MNPPRCGISVVKALLRAAPTVPSDGPIWRNTSPREANSGPSVGPTVLAMVAIALTTPVINGDTPESADCAAVFKPSSCPPAANPANSADRSVRVCLRVPFM